MCQYLKSGAVVKFDKSKKLIQTHEYDHWLNFEYIHILREKVNVYINTASVQHISYLYRSSKPIQLHYIVTLFDRDNAH